MLDDALIKKKLYFNEQIRSYFAYLYIDNFNTNKRRSLCGGMNYRTI